MDNASRYLEDFSVGMEFHSGPKLVSEADIIRYATEYDPQYYHLDPEAAKHSQFGQLIGSGLHTLSLSFRLFFDLDLWPKAIIASPGMNNLKWLLPLLPGDAISISAEITEVRPSRSKPDRGLVIMDHKTTNQRGEVILTVECLHMLRRRPEPAAGG